ncbi:hypothetical protein ACFOZY_09760 [Chungangia koreensis]|uniref:Uncharacterized protein n=1 Tax=Chungangia koreensis TaxID=752657 RepID=A0ABV8X5L9_9LACT
MDISTIVGGYQRLSGFINESDGYQRLFGFINDCWVDINDYSDLSTIVERISTIVYLSG